MQGVSEGLRVLAIDAATATGWASGDRYGVKEFPLRRGSSAGMRFIEFRSWLRDLIQTARPEVVVYEIAHQRGGAATELCVGFTTRVMEEAEAFGCEYKGCHSRTLKAFATGNGNASKEQMIQAARERFPEIRIESDDLADALLLHAWAEAGFPDVVTERKRAEAATKRLRAEEKALDEAIVIEWLEKARIGPGVPMQAIKDVAAARGISVARVKAIWNRQPLAHSVGRQAGVGTG